MTVKSLGLTDRNFLAISINDPHHLSSVTATADFRVTGIATDDATGVDRVAVRIERLDDDSITYWNGATWQPTPAGTFEKANLSGNSWFLANVDLSEPGYYRIRSTVRDRAGNQRQSSQNPIVNFKVLPDDNTPPASTVVTPENDSLIEPGQLSILGLSSDDISDIDKVLVRIQTFGKSTTRFWNGNALQIEPVWLPAEIASDNT